MSSTKRTADPSLNPFPKRTRVDVFATGMSNEDKTVILQTTLKKTLSADDLRLLACDHMVRIADSETLRATLACHTCSFFCAVRTVRGSGTPPGISPSLSESPSVVASEDYDTTLSNTQKQATLSFLLATKLENAPYRDLLVVASDHGVKRSVRPTLWQTMREHTCSWSCLIRKTDAVRAGQRAIPLDVLCAEQGQRRTYEQIAQATREEEYLQSHRPINAVNGGGYIDGLSPIEKFNTLRHLLTSSLKSAAYIELLAIAVDHGIQERGSADISAALCAHRCTWHCLVRQEHFIAASHQDVSMSSTDPPDLPHLVDDESCAPQSPSTPVLQPAVVDDGDESDVRFWKENWPQVEDWNSLKTILKESRAATSSDVLRRLPCSFCDMNEVASRVHIWDTNVLDISLLENAVAELRSQYEVPEIVSHRLYGGKFQSWANGCWVGDVPEELAGLTFAEELVISRAHATKTWIKLSADQTCHQQRASHGNVCIHPHEIVELASKLPLPATALYDQIVVIIVTNDRAATAEMFNRTPLLVRPSKLLNALRWLHIHNRLYRDIEFDPVALESYNPDGSLPFPIQYLSQSATTQGQSATYTGHGADTAETLFSQNCDETDSQIPLSTTGTFDVDLTETLTDLRKLEELRHLKEDRPFVKTSQSSETMNTRNNPDVYGLLWPTLFPYGVGLFEDPVRQKPGFRSIHLKSHVAHLLQTSDTRFQTHLSFIFIMQNVMMLRRSSHRSRLAVRRGWWPKAMAAMDLVNDDVLKHMTDVLVGKKARKDYTPYHAESEAEQAALDLLRYLEYCSDHIEGSTAEVMVMRQEIRALCNDSGTPSIFFTLNPADTFNPLCSFVSGHDINLDTPFNQPDSRYSAFQRATSLAANPVGGARFFKLMVDQLLNVFLGFERQCRRGVFGRVKHYYGVVEAQNRGSLHLHILIWLEGALSPRQIQERCGTDDDFRSRLFAWLDSIIKYELPEDGPAESSLSAGDKRSLLSRPPDPHLPNFDDLWTTYLAHVLAAVSQIHSHSDTCFKKIVRAFALLTVEERDQLCRFFYPQDVVPETYINEDGRIFFRRLHRFMVGHNPTVTGGLQCNTDGKFVGSGSFGMALSVYMTNYTAKSSLDSAIVMSALAAALAALGKEMANADEDQCRSLLLKTLNQMNGRRELSGQQVACSILAIPNHFTDLRFVKAYWSSTLTWLSPAVFEPPPSVVEDEHPLSDAHHETSGDGSSPDAEPLHLADTFVTFHQSHREPPLSSLVYDILYRPEALEDLCMWDILGQYEKVSLAKSADEGLADDIYHDGDCADNEEPQGKAPVRPILPFACGHPQQSTHGMRRRTMRHVPVLLGCPVPRRDLQEQSERYAVAMLALFTPWVRSQTEPLHSENISASAALSPMLSDLDPRLRRVVDHMQEQWECRDAAADFSAMSRQRYAAFAAGGSVRPLNFETDEDELSHDLNWQLGQLDNEHRLAIDIEILEPPASSDFYERCGLRALQAVNATRVLTNAANIYTSCVTDKNYIQKIGGAVRNVCGDDDGIAAAAAEKMAGDRAAVRMGRHSRNDASVESIADSHKNRDYTKWYNAPMQTTLSQEAVLAEAQSIRAHNGDDHYWRVLEDWKKLAISVLRSYTLNREQRLAFLLITSSRLRLLSDPHRPPYRLIVAGPGGTGKSRMYDALKTFYTALHLEHELTFTAPTGIAAANIGGSTVSAELSLRVSLKSLLAANSRSLATLSDRLQFTKTLIIDEFLFMGTAQFEKASRHINLARHCVDDPFGHLDIILSGDQFQLLCPNTTSLYNHRYTSLADVSAGVQSLNDSTRRNAIAIKNYWDVRNCVVFDKVVRQECPRYVALLTRLRKGICTTRGNDSDLAYLQQFEIGHHRFSTVDDPVNVGRWVEASLLPPEDEHKSRAAPLVTYTNYARNMHNWNMAQAFSTATGQDFGVYYAQDFVGSGKKCVELTGRNAEAAWRTPIKTNASDLSGRLPLVVGMPVLMVDNKAVELGLCNGASGRLISVDYTVHANRRYALSAEVDFPGYTNPSADAAHTHRAVVVPSRKAIEYMFERDSKVYTAKRSQLPLIPGFSFTVHNSQSRTLNCLTAHLESCSSIAASYVLLSRIRCGVDGPCGLHILGEVREKNIVGHVSEETRKEEERLKRLADDTKLRAVEELRWYSDAVGTEL